MADTKTIKFEIVTPEREVFKEMVAQVTVPTRNGEITILPHHIPLVSILAPGVIEVRQPDGNIEVMSVSGGFIEVLKDKIVILADTAERAAEIDISRAEVARARAEETRKNLERQDAEQFTSVAAKIAKEMARTRAANRWRRIKGMEK
ncbi:MAG: ATP synthase F1 subunit epsilon [Patescibacteria group bacterium]|jgi:F-type H+-transporting ATPase subunit epsilon